jgi:hypothetical protein
MAWPSCFDLAAAAAIAICAVSASMDAVVNVAM